MFMVMVNYPQRGDELEVLKRTTGETPPKVSPVIEARRIVELQRIVRRVPVGDHVYHHSTRSTRRIGRSGSRCA